MGHWFFRSRQGVGPCLADRGDDLFHDPFLEFLGCRQVGVGDQMVQILLVDDGIKLGATSLTVPFRYSHFLCVKTVLCDGTSAVYVPQIVANFLGHPPGITLAIDDCGQREFAKIERDDQNSLITDKVF
jgi:hypothetical protein